VLCESYSAPMSSRANARDLGCHARPMSTDIRVAHRVRRPKLGYGSLLSRLAFLVFQVAGIAKLTSLFVAGGTSLVVVCGVTIGAARLVQQAVRAHDISRFRINTLPGGYRDSGEP
jgi:hypothetical protein